MDDSLPMPATPMVDVPSTSGEPLEDIVRLNMVAGVGPRLYQQLVGHFGSATAVLAANVADLQQVRGVGSKLADKIAHARDQIDVAAELAQCRRSGVQLLTPAATEYPASLREIHDPPAVLYVRGQIVPEDALAIAVVGSRRCTHYGQRQTERLAGGLARAGFTIVSGLARGIDGVAHRAALEAGGRTIAVLGSGLANIYPPEHEKLAGEVVSRGALVSELPMSYEPLAGLFPQRNRIISGLSLGVLVVEANRRSGALITARHASEQGREVFAVPGRIDSLVSQGCHHLIRDGAKLVESVDDVLEELGPLAGEIRVTEEKTVRHPAELKLNELEQQVLQLLGDDAVATDEVVNRSGLPAGKVLATLSVLEMKRLARRLPGNQYVRAP